MLWIKEESVASARRFVLMKDDLVLGRMELAGNFLQEIQVDAAWRRKGYGTYLFRQALKRSSVGPKETLTAPSTQDPALRAFLEKFGFREQGQQMIRQVQPQRNALSIAHAFLRDHVRPGMVAIDATAGNGYDTVFLCELVGPKGKVLAMDIQPAAVHSTCNRLRSLGLSQAKVVCDSHANLAEYAQKGTVDAIMFNLGYLPGGDHGVFTVPKISIPALQTALELLRPGGVMTVCTYSGGLQGTDERDAVLDFVGSLPNERYEVSVERFASRSGFPPVPICIYKR